MLYRNDLMNDCDEANENVQPLVVGCIEKLVLTDIGLFLPEIQVRSNWFFY